MWPKIVRKVSVFCLTLFLCVTCFTATYNDANAGYEGVRDVRWDSSTKKCEGVDDLNPNPFWVNQDINWEITNPICITYASLVGATLITAGCVAGSLCANPTACGIKSALVAIGIPLSAADAKRQAQNQIYCAAQTASCAIPATAAVACPLATACCNSHIADGVTVLLSFGSLMVIYGVAQDAYKYATICGHNWKTWAKVDEEGIENSSGNWSRGAYAGSRKKDLQDLFKNNPTEPRTMTSKNYREYVFGGVETIDNGDGACSNPSSWDSAKRTRILGYDSDKQRYYMTGPDSASVYACHRFLASNRNDTGAQAAYECCKKRSQKALCIKSRNTTEGWDYKFCEIGSRCNVVGVWYDVFASQKSPNYACAETFSVCPYNHPLGGGTEVEEYLDSDQKYLKNFCQVRSHCSKIPVTPFIRTSNLTGAHISSACRDLKGDTQNTYAYSSDIIPVNSRGFSAPIAQCFKETMENVFLNKNGHSICKDPDEFPDANEVCASGEYEFQKGKDGNSTSFFVKIQNNLQSAIKMALTISVMALGFKMLLLGGKIDPQAETITKKDLMGYILKIALVMYFAAGDGWQLGFMKGVINSSSTLSDIVFSIETSPDPVKQDGCQFPKFNYADSNPDTMYDNPAYPPGLEYLRVWDTLDCKITKALGFGPEVSVPNLFMMIMGGFLTGGAGIVFMVATLMFAFFFIAITIKALHIFLLSITSIVILIYVSPITIVLAMFARTKSIFDGWWKQILAYALQPMILFAYMGVLISVFDSVAIGDVEFSGDGRTAPKSAICDTSGSLSVGVSSGSVGGVSTPSVSGSVSGFIPGDESLYCIFGIAEMKNFPGFEVVGIGLPVLIGMTKAKVFTIMKAAMLLFIFMNFLEKISSLATALVGGNELKTGSAMINMAIMASTTGGALRGIQKRGMNLASKVGGTAARKGGEIASTAKGAMGQLASKGKSAEGEENGAARDMVGGAVDGGGGNIPSSPSPTPPPPPPPPGGGTGPSELNPTKDPVSKPDKMDTIMEGDEEEDDDDVPPTQDRTGGLDSIAEGDDEDGDFEAPEGPLGTIDEDDGDDDDSSGGIIGGGNNGGGDDGGSGEGDDDGDSSGDGSDGSGLIGGLPGGEKEGDKGPQDEKPKFSTPEDENMDEEDPEEEMLDEEQDDDQFEERDEGPDGESIPDELDNDEEPEEPEDQDPAQESIEGPDDESIPDEQDINEEEEEEDDEPPVEETPPANEDSTRSTPQGDVEEEDDVGEEMKDEEQSIDQQDDPVSDTYSEDEPTEDPEGDEGDGSLDDSSAASSQGGSDNGGGESPKPQSKSKSRSEAATEKRNAEGKARRAANAGKGKPSFKSGGGGGGGGKGGVTGKIGSRNWT